jgi:hypothetical protein
MTTYQPELGQAVFGAPTGEHELPEYALALFRGVWREIARVFWNREQREFNGYGTEDPKLPGFTVRPYRSDDTPEAELPNFVFGDAELRWYKYPGRGMSANVDWKPDQWVAWFDAAMKAIRDYEEARDKVSLPPQKPLDEDDDENPF